MTEQEQQEESETRQRGPSCVFVLLSAGSGECCQLCWESCERRIDHSRPDTLHTSHLHRPDLPGAAADCFPPVSTLRQILRWGETGPWVVDIECWCETSVACNVKYAGRVMLWRDKCNVLGHTWKSHTSPQKLWAGGKLSSIKWMQIGHFTLLCCILWLTWPYLHCETKERNISEDYMILCCTLSLV